MVDLLTQVWREKNTVLWLCLLEGCESKWPEVWSRGQRSQRGECRVEQLKQDQGQEQGRVEAGSVKSTSETERNHWPYTRWSLEHDWSVWFNCPLIGGQLNRFEMAKLCGETVNLPGVWKLLFSVYWGWLDWAVYNGFILVTGKINYYVLTKLLCYIKATLSEMTFPN